MDPISYAVAAELFRIADAAQGAGNASGWSRRSDSSIDHQASSRAIELGLVQTVGWNRLFPSQRLTPKGESAVREGLAAMREVK